ncbi:MAG TPA: hypothetical protein VFD23_03770 [Clostridia bacterium]|nr:hypothetical protein [Clostridia bacterium]
MKTTYADFSEAVIFIDKNISDVEQKAVSVLVDEILKRTGIRLETVTKYPNNAAAVIAVGSRWLQYIPAAILTGTLAEPGKEGYRLAIAANDKPLCAVLGADSRGMLYGIGKLLRLMRWSECKLLFPLKTAISDSPKFPIRGHQLAYRPKTNAYDAWTPAIFDQYIRELALFGANTIDILPPDTDDQTTNDLMQYDALDMMVMLSEIIHSYGLETGVWYPNMFGQDVDEQKLLQEDLQREEIFARVPYIDHLFIPGGDPGKLFPEKLFEVAQRFVTIARRHHPEVKLWISPQTFCPSEEWSEGFYAAVKKQPEWLDGLCFAPWERDNIDTLRKRTPKRYPIRNYADICHSLRCQYPVPKWDLTLALTLGREFVNPRPKEQKHIHNLYCKHMAGSVCYSEGINDDLNKFVWLDQEWNPKTPVKQTLLEYGRLFISSGAAEDLAAGIFLLEDNLHGKFAQNPSVKQAYALWTKLEDRLTGFAVGNYRFELHLLRACFDHYQQQRYLYEHALEEEALKTLADCDASNVDLCIEKARQILNKAVTHKILPEVAQKINLLADRLFEHIGAQLTVSRHQAASWDRGAFVECLDIPLNDKRYILAQMDEAEKRPSQKEKTQAVIKNITHRTDPGEGGFYDNFGSDESWHRLENHDDYKKDPGFFKTPLLSFLMPPPHDEDDNRNIPLAWRQNVYTLYQTPLFVNYDGLDPTADYSIRTVYGKYRPIHIRLSAGPNGDIPIHGEISVSEFFVTAENPLPKESYKDGKLRLKFMVRDGERGPNVSEIFIRRLSLHEQTPQPIA